MLGTDADRAAVLVDLATPVVITGLADRAFAPGGNDIVVRLLDGVDPTIVDNPLVFVERGDATVGEGLLVSIFAGEHAALTTTLAEQGNVAEPVMARLLPGILALAIGVLGRRRAIRGVDDAGVMTLLKAEKSGLPGDRIPAMAGAATSATSAALSSGPLETDRTTAEPADDRTQTAAGATTTPTASLTSDGGPPATDDGSERDDRSSPNGRDGSAPLVFIVGGLITVVVLAWALSQLSGAGPETAADSEGSTDPVEQTDDGTTGDAGSDGDSETPPPSDETDASDAGADSDDATDSSSEPPDDPETTEPVTINEELSLDPITFEVGSATITAEGLDVLDEAAQYLKADPELTIEIAGHTDSDGDAAANIRLSQARADEVKGYLESLGIEGSRMTPIGYGEDNPVASNDTEAGKAQNRRIEFVIR